MALKTNQQLNFGTLPLAIEKSVFEVLVGFWVQTTQIKDFTSMHS